MFKLKLSRIHIVTTLDFLEASLPWLALLQGFFLLRDLLCCLSLCLRASPFSVYIFYFHPLNFDVIQRLSALWSTYDIREICVINEFIYVQE